MPGAVKEAKNLVLAILAACVLWFLASGTAREAVYAQLAVIELEKWALTTRFLKDAYNTSNDSAKSLTEYKIGETIKAYNRPVQVQSGTQVDVAEKFAVSAPWNPELREDFALVARYSNGGLHIFDIVGTTSNIIPNDIKLMILDDRRDLFVIQSKFISMLQTKNANLRDYHNVVLRDKLYGPENASEALNYLRARGWEGKAIDDIDPYDPKIISAVRQSREQRYTVSGIPIEMTFVPTAICFLLGFLGFSLLGPIIKMQSAEGRIDEEAWILAVKLPGRFGALLMVAQISFGLALAALPILVIFDQLFIIPILNGFNRFLWQISIFFYLCCSLIILLFTLKLNEVRDRTPAETANFDI